MNVIKLERLGRMQIESATHQGYRRTNNEDRFLVRYFAGQCALLVIADGMGGHAAGEIAAQLAVDCFQRFVPSESDINGDLAAQMDAAHDDILKESLSDLSMTGMGTTLTALFINGSSAHWAHLGDTRIYLLHDDILSRITNDHTLAGDLLKRGDITKEEARFHPYGNILTRCAGCEQHTPDSGSFALHDGDLVLLSSDGLHDLISDEEIYTALSADIPLAARLQLMIDRCLEAGGRDNITGVLASI